MARCARCNKVMLFAKNRDLCNNCWELEIMEQAKRRDASEKSRLKKLEVEKQKEAEAKKAKKREEELRLAAERRKEEEARLNIEKRRQEEQKRREEEARKNKELELKQAEEKLNTEMERLKEEKYKLAMSKMELESSTQLQEAKKMFSSLGDYKDAAQKAHKCDDLLTRLNKASEQKVEKVKEDKTKSIELADPAAEAHKKANQYLMGNSGVMFMFNLMMNRTLGFQSTTYETMKATVRDELERGGLSKQELDLIDYDEYIEPYVDEIDWEEDTQVCAENKRRIMRVIEEHKQQKKALAKKARVEKEESKRAQADSSVKKEPEPKKKTVKPAVIRLEKDLSEEEKQEAQKLYDQGCKLFGSSDSADQKKSAPLFLKAAEAGLAIAQTQIGNMYALGQGVDEDMEKAVMWTKRAADQNYPMALANLAGHYLKGEGVEKDETKAVELYKKAAELDDEYAAWALGKLYQDGVGVNKDVAKARKYYLQAISNGSLNAFKELLKDGREKQKGRDACRETVKEEFDAFFSMLKKLIPVRDGFIPQGEFDAAIEAKRNLQFIKANRLYMYMALRHGVLASNIGNAWIKVLGGMGDTKDLLRLGKYMLAANTKHENEYAWANLEDHCNTVERCIRENDLESLIERLYAMAGKVSISANEIDVGSEIAQRVEEKKKAEEAERKAAEEAERKAVEEAKKRAEQEKKQREAENKKTAEVKQGKKIASFHTKVVGVTFKNEDGSDRQSIIRDLITSGTMRVGTEMILWPDVHNAYDSNCVLVMAPDGRTIGSLPKEIAARVSPDLLAGYTYKAFVFSQSLGSAGYSSSVQLMVDKYDKAATDQYSQANAQKDFEQGKEFYSQERYSLAFPLLMKAAEFGYAEAQYYVGMCYDYGYGVSEDKYEANRWYELAAEQGNAAAQCDLGLNIEHGEGAPQDYERAMYWIKKAADQNLPNALNSLGKMYEEGRGVPADDKKAFEYYLKSAKLGGREGAQNAGMFLLIGKGVERDPAEAAKWNRKAAEMGSDKAQYNLGMQLINGDGVPCNLDEGPYWIRRAAANGHPMAIQLLVNVGEL